MPSLKRNTLRGNYQRDARRIKNCILMLFFVLVRMAALQHYLYEEDLKAGDTGAAAVIAAEKEEMAHQQNIKVGDLVLS